MLLIINFLLFEDLALTIFFISILFKNSLISFLTSFCNSSPIQRILLFFRLSISVFFEIKSYISFFQIENFIGFFTLNFLNF